MSPLVTLKVLFSPAWFVVFLWRACSRELVCSGTRWIGIPSSGKSDLAGPSRTGWGTPWDSAEEAQRLITCMYDDFYLLGSRVVGTMLWHSRRTSVLQSDCSLHWSSGDCIDHKHVGSAEGFKADLGSPPHTFLMSFTQQLEKRTDLWKLACRIINPRKLIYLKLCVPNQSLRFCVDEMTLGLLCSLCITMCIIVDVGSIFGSAGALRKKNTWYGFTPTARGRALICRTAPLGNRRIGGLSAGLHTCGWSQCVWQQKHDDGGISDLLI